MQVTDPLTGAVAPIFNPRVDDWEKHFAWEQGGLFVVGSTACGRGTAAVLALNDRYHLSARAVWMIARVYPPT